MVPLAEIASADNDYNLNISRYVDSSDAEDVQDLQAHLRGGIPQRDIEALRTYWEAFPSLRTLLFEPNRPGYLDLAVDVAEVQQMILGSEEFTQFAQDAQRVVSEWFAEHRSTLASISENTRPNELISALGDDLLARFKPVPLLDEYDVYEQLLSYWHDTMHDDVFLVMDSGWARAAKPRPARVGKDKSGKAKYEEADIVTGTGKSLRRFVMDLIPPHLVVTRYLADEQAKVEQLAILAEKATRNKEEYLEEHATEDGLLADAVDDKGNVTQRTAKDAWRLASAERDEEATQAIEQTLALFKQEAAAKKTAKEAQAELDAAVVAAYGPLSLEDLIALTVDDKWYASVLSRVQTTVNALTLALVNRIEQLGQRYSVTCEDLDSQLAEVDARVLGHLEALGVG